MSAKTAQKQSSPSIQAGTGQPVSPSFQFINYANPNLIMSEPHNLVLDASITPVNEYKSTKVPSTRDSSNSQPALSNATLVPNGQQMLDAAFVDKNYLFDNGAAVLSHNPDSSGYSQQTLSPTTSTRQHVIRNSSLGFNGNITPITNLTSSSSGVDLLSSASGAAVSNMMMMPAMTSVPSTNGSGISSNLNQAPTPNVMADLLAMFGQDGTAPGSENGVSGSHMDSLTLPTLAGDINNINNNNNNNNNKGSIRGQSVDAGGSVNDHIEGFNDLSNPINYACDELNSLDNLLDGFVSPHMDPLTHSISNTSIPMASIDGNVFSVDRRASAVVSGLGPIPMRSTAKNSISHALDAWNIGTSSNNATVSNKTAQKNNTIDSSVAQTLNGYSMNFGLSNSQTKAGASKVNGNGPTPSSTGSGESPDVDATVSEIKEASDCRSPGHSSPSAMHSFSVQQSRSFLDAAAASQGVPNVEQIPNDLFASLYTPFGFFNNEPCVTPLADTTVKNNSGTPKSVSTSPEHTEPVVKSSPKTKFIKPSMILADSSKLGFTGGAKRSSVSFPSIVDTQVYHPVSRVSKRKSVSSSSTMNSKSDPYGRRRRSVIGLADTLPLSGSSSTSLNVSPLSVTPVLPSAGSNGAVSMTASSTPIPISRSATSSTVDDKSAKPFQCSECDKAFRRSEHLKRHIRSVHSSERPFHCVLCEKKFSRSDNLSQHLKTHKRHGDF